MYDALYYPIHRAKKGEISGTAHLAPLTLTRVRPVFEVQKPGEDDDVPLVEYLATVATDIAEAWDHRFPLFADFPRFAPEERTSDGKHCIEHFFQCMRQHGMLAMPVTGPESVRGPGYTYLEAVAAVAEIDGRGVAIRLPVNEFSERGKLENALTDTLQVIRLEPESIDLFLDFEIVAFLPNEYRSAEGLVSLLIEPLRYVARAGFRNIVICGSCIPEMVDKRYNGRAMRVERTDFLAWQMLVGMFKDFLIKRGDSGVIFALEQDANGPVRPPARIRLSTPREYVLWRAPRKEYLSLSEQVAKSADFDPQLDAWGTTALLQCARFGRGNGGPTEWVARDTNLSTEVTVRAMEAFLKQAGRLSALSFAPPERFPWNQALIDTSQGRS